MLRSKRDVDKHIKDVLSKLRTSDERHLRGYNFARLYFDIKEYDSARRYLSEFLTVRPKASDAHRLMGQILELQDNKVMALEAYKTSYHLGQIQKDLVLKICDIYTHIDADKSVKLYWAEEGNRLYPHHETVLKLQESLITGSDAQSREDLESLYLDGINARPLLVTLHINLLLLYKRWGADDKSKINEGYQHACRVEAGKAFIDSLEWYQALIDTMEDYQNYEDVSHDKEFQMNYLAALERLVYLTLASSSGTALLSPCTLNDAATFLKRFDQKLTTGLAVIGPGTQFGQVMAGQLYLNMAIFLLSNAQKECLTPTSITAGALLFHACRFQTTEIDRQSKSWKSRDQFWYKLACHRLSQAAHVLEHMASTETDKKTYLEKVKVRCSNKEVQGNIYKTVFGATMDNKKSVLQSTLENKDQSFFLKDQGFIDASLSYPEPDQVKEWDNVVGSMYCASLGDLVWLCLQQTPMNLNPQPYYSFTLFEGLPFYSSRINTGAAETLCHIDLLAFLAATVYCQIAALKEAHGPPPASLPTVIASALNTVEQADWWTAAYTLFTNRVHQSYMKQRLTLQRGLEVIRVQGNHGVALPLLAHLAQCFTNWATAAEGDGSTNNEIDALKDRAELYWQEALQLCHKTSRNLPIVVPRNPLFVVQYVNLTSEEVAKIEMEGKYFLAMRLVHAGKQQEAIQALGELKSPEASFQRALLYKEQGQALLGEGNVESVTSEKRSQHTTLLTQARDTFYLTLDRLRMPGVDRGHPLHTKLNQQLQDVERRLSHMALDKSVSRQQEDDTESISDASQSPSPDLENVITNLPQTPHLFSTPYTEKKSSARITRQEARSSRERLDAQVRALSEVQENTLRNMEEQNAALKAQNEALRNFCTTMADEFKENASLYRSMLDQNKSLSQEVYASIIKEMKQIHSTLLVETKDLQSTVKDLQGQVHAMAVDLGEVRAMKSTVKHSEVTEVKASDEQVPVDLPASLYGGYINYYNQQAVPSPLMPTPGLFGNPPFFPPSTMPEQSFSMSTSMSEGATISTLAQTNTSMVTPALASPASITVKDPVTSQSGMFSTQNWNLATTGASNNRLPPDASPPAHAFQIAMPPVSNALTPPPRSVPGESLSHTLPCSTTAGLLANVPPPLYSAVTPDSSPVRGESHIQSLSTVMSTEGLSTASDNLVAPSAASGSRDSSLTYTGAFTSGGLSEPKISPIKNKEAADEDTDRYIEDDHDPCPDFKPVVPLPEKVEVRTGEEDEEVLFEERAKLFRFVDKEWRERGTGVMKLLHNPSQGSARVLMRRDQTHKICANHLVTENIDIQPMKKNDKVWIWAAQDFADESLRMEKFCCRFKTVEIATSFRDAFVKAKEIARNKEEMDKIQQEVNKPPQEPSNQTLTTATKPTSLAEMFKPTAGSWSCSTCLVLNTQEKTKCAACETLNPNAPKAKEPVEETLTPFASFKFTPSSKTEGGASAYPVGFRFGGTTPLSSVVKSTPVSTSTTTAIGFQFGVSSVSIVPVTASFPVASTSSLATVTTDSLKDSSKMSLPGFTFTSASTALSFKPETTEGSQPKPQEDKKKVSIFAEFSFGTNANNTPTTGFAFSTPSTDIKEEEDNTGVPASTGGPIGGDTSGSMLTFGSVAATSASAGLFTTKVPQAFEPKTLFGISTGSPSKDDSDDKVEEYEPQVDFQPVIPMPDLVEVKTGEEGEEKLFCERAKLYRYDKDSKEWKERGVGELKVLKNNSSGKVRVLMRRDQIHKVCANHFLTADMKLSPMKVSDKAWIWAAHDYADQEMKEEQFAARFKTQELALAFKEAFEKAQHSLSTSTTAETTAPVPPPQDTVTSTTKSLADMFRPAAGSWECGVCLVRNTAASKLCVSCSSKKPCSEPSNEDVTDATIESKPAFSFSISKTPSQSSSGFMFGTGDSKQSFSFGIPQTSKATTETTSLSTISFGVPNNSTQDSAAPSENKPAFSFGCSYDQFNKPFNFTWQPIQGTTAGSVDSSSSSTTSTFSSSSFSATGPIVIPKSTREDPTTPTKDEKSGFVFGSPGKYEFSFTGIKAKSPRSRNTSYCESEDGVVEEDDGDHLYFEPVVPLPEKVEVVTGEEDEDVLYVHRAKLFRHVAGEWKERGLGDIKILSHKQNGKIRLLMRREQVHKLCLNHTLNIDIEFRKKDDKTYYWAAVDYTESTPQNETFAVRFKTPEIALDFIKAVNDAKVKLGGSPVELPATTISSPVKLEDNTREKSPKTPAMPTPSQFTPPDSTTPITSASTKPAGLFFEGTPGKSTLGGSPGNLFGGMSTPTIIWGTVTSTPSIFGGTVTPTPSIFGGTVTPTPSIFGGAVTPTPTTFGGTPIFGVSSSNTAPTFSANVSTNFTLKTPTQLGTPSASTVSHGAGGSSLFGGATSTSTATRSSFSFGDRFSSEPDSSDTIEVVYEKKATPEQIEMARKLKLPDNFYLYEDAPGCPGCRGCEDDRDEVEKDKQETTADSSTLTFSSVTTSFSSPTLFGSLPSNSLSTFGRGNASSSPSVSETTATSAQGVFGISSVFNKSNTPRSTTASIFNTAPSTTTGMFGLNTTPSTTTSMFGLNTTPSTTTGMFGLSTTPSTTTIIFGFNTIPSSTTTSIFGSNTTPSTTSILGSNTTPSLTTNILGSNATSSTTTSMFGLNTTPSTTTKILGLNATPSTTTSILGLNATPSMTTSILGPSTTASTVDPFGTTAATLFGNKPTVSTGLFSSPFNTTAGVTTTESTDTTSSAVETPSGGGLFSDNNTSAVSFGDLAARAPDTNFGESGPTKNLTWQLKAEPVFGKSPKKTSDEEDGADNSDAHDPHFEPIVPLPDLVEVKTGEEDMEVIFSNRAKLYRYDGPSKQWKERGVGNFKILLDRENNKYRLLQRRELVHKTCCNQYLKSTLELQPLQNSENSWCWSGRDYSENLQGTDELLAIKFKNKELAVEFSNKVAECQMKLRLHDDLSCSSNSVKPTGVDEEDGVDDDDEDDDEDDEEEDGVDDKNEEKEDVEHEDEDTVIFKKNCAMYIQENDSWQELAVGDLCITCPNNNGDGGARIIMTTGSGDFVVEDTLTRYSTMKKECYAATWTSSKSELVVATSYQVVFSSSSDLDEFETAFSKASAYCI